MASNGTPRLGQVVRFLLPSHKRIAVFLVTEVALSLLGAPLVVHLIVGGFIHFVPNWGRHWE